MIGCVDFSGHEEMYEALKNNVKAVQKQYIIFDDQNKTMWLCWSVEDIL